jgi:hypothetical protein
MPIEVELPNGSIAEFPDGTPPEQIQSVLQGQFAPQAEPEGFTGAGVVEPLATMVTGAVAEPLAGLAGIIQAANPFADPGAGARAVEATREALTFQPRTEAGKEGLQAVGEVVAPVAEGLETAEKFLGDTAFEATGSPTLAAAATTIPAALLEVVGVAGAKGGLKASAKLKQAREASKAQRSVVESAPSIEQLKEVSRGVYRELDESGVALKPKTFQSLVDNINKNVRRQGFDPDLTPKTAGVLRRLSDEVGGVKSLTDIDTLRKVAQNAASAIEPADARLGAMIIDEFDSFLDGVNPDQLIRGKSKISDVGPKYKVARELWGRARRSELINEAFDKAKNQASGFENGIVVQFRSILNNKKKSRMFKPAELDAMRKVVRGTTATNMAKLVGRLGFSEGHATNLIGGSLGIAAGAQLGGPIGAVAVPAIGQLSRKLAQKLTRGNAEFADLVVRAGTDANDIAMAYMRKVPKKARSAEELSELLARPDIALDKLLNSSNTMLREAAEIGRGRQILNAVGTASRQAAPATAAIGAIESTREGQ